MSKLGDELVQSMAQALAHAQGKRSGVRTYKVAVSPDDTHVDVNAVHHAIPSTSITGRVAGSLERLRYDAP